MLIIILILIIVFAVAFITRHTRKVVQRNDDYVLEPYDHFTDFNKINEILTMPVNPGNVAINNLQESLTTGTSQFCHPCDSFNPDNKPCDGKCPKCPEPFLGYGQPCSSCIKKPKQVPEKLIDRVIVRQPFFLNGPVIRDYYDCLYYNDFRYPERPIPLIFAKDPEGYCDKYPNRYPCYVRYSRHDLK